MDITKLSKLYAVKRLSENDIDSVLELCRGNPLYYQHCPPAATRESIAEDMVVLPPGVTPEDKFFLGIYDGTKLMAVMDLVLHYPNEKTAFIGFFMVSAERQRRGLGTALITELLEALLTEGYAFTKLGYVKGNPQPRAFWHKNGFAETGAETDAGEYTIVAMQRSNRCYYKAYDERYKVIHEKNRTWASETPTPIVLATLRKYNIAKETPILEIGCGEGRDSIALLKEGYRLTAGDVSPEAIRYCREKYPEFRASFAVMDACRNEPGGVYDFVFAAAVLHMLVRDEDRRAFLRSVHNRLSGKGRGLILTMGDGVEEFCTDAETAYEMQERSNNADGIPVLVPNTSCRMVSFAALERELRHAGLIVLESGITQCLPDFPSLMYVVVGKG